MTIEQRCEPSIVFLSQLLLPGGLAKDFLEHEGIDEDHRNLQEMEREDSNLLRIEAVGRDLPMTTEEDK